MQLHVLSAPAGCEVRDVGDDDLLACFDTTPDLDFTYKHDCIRVAVGSNEEYTSSNYWSSFTDSLVYIALHAYEEY